MFKKPTLSSFFPFKSSPRLAPGFLLVIPLATYLLSYLYLAFYHQKINLWNQVVHESGKLTFYQDLFYSSHFLAHIPVHITLALFFTGIYASLSPGMSYVIKHRWAFGLALLVYLGFCFAHSFYEFGFTDTRDYFLQRKQGADRFGEGGSWKLHLVSTLSIPFFIPLYVSSSRWLCARPTAISSRGWPYLVSAGILLFLFSNLLEGESLYSLCIKVFTDNRYLAHSVREVATFSLTYFPLVLFIFFKMGPEQSESNRNKDKLLALIIFFCTGIFLLLFFYQTYHPLTEGVGTLAQKPEFAKGGELSVIYLLASHFFEHFLDTIFFALFATFVFLGNSRSERKTINAA